MNRFISFGDYHTGRLHLEYLGPCSPSSWKIQKHRRGFYLFTGNRGFSIDNFWFKK